MRPGGTPELTAALESVGITTALMARLDFASGTVAVWTGTSAIQATGSGDVLLDGLTFDPFVHGIALQISDNVNSYTGSEPLTITLGVPGNPSTEMAAASVYPSEYQGRQATLWRAIQVPNSDPLGAPIWMFRRVRSGAMDKIEIQNDGAQHNITLTIEGHAANLSQVTQASYLDQRRLDPNDSSQDFAPSIANGKLAPGQSASGWMGVNDLAKDVQSRQ